MYDGKQYIQLSTDGTAAPSDLPGLQGMCTKETVHQLHDTCQEGSSARD